MSVIEQETVAVPVPMEEPYAARILRRAADLLDEFGWCQVSYARDAADNPLQNPADPQAASFCVLGAIWRAEAEAGFVPHEIGDENEVIGEHPMRFFQLAVGRDPIVFNDEVAVSKEDVQEALRRAAARAPA